MTTGQAPVRTVYALEPDVRIRPLPEWAGALVYTPHSPDLHYLNTTAWTVLELCPGRTPDELAEAFVEFVGDTGVEPEQARELLADTVATLRKQHIIAETG